jgi:hypothetical protein
VKYGTLFLALDMLASKKWSSEDKQGLQEMVGWGILQGVMESISLTVFHQRLSPIQRINDDE